MKQKIIKLSLNDEILLEKLKENNYILVQPGSRLEKSMERLERANKVEKMTKSRFTAK